MEIQFQSDNNKLIEKCRAGDSKSQMQLYRLYYKAMYNVSLRILNNAADSEDIMQEAFITAFSKLEYYEGKVSFGAWLKKIVINKSLDELRKRKPFFEDIEKLSEHPEEENFEHEEFSNQIKVGQIKTAICNLPDGYRIILSLYLLEGYDHEEIGEILNITSSTSRSQFTRAKRKLKELLSQMSVFQT